MYVPAEYASVHADMAPLPHPTLPASALHWLQGATALTFGTPFVTGGNLKLGHMSDSSLSPGLPNMVLPAVC